MTLNVQNLKRNITTHYIQLMNAQMQYIFVNNLKNNRSPGLDGISAEFYECSLKTMGPLF